MNEQERIECPHCTNSDLKMLELIITTKLFAVWQCEVCSKSFQVPKKEQ